MNKILVTTDFSVNSKAGIRFALQLEKQTKCKLIFYHTQEILQPTRWSTDKYQAYAGEELRKTHTKLMHFVKSLYRQTGFASREVQCVVAEGSTVDRSVIEYAKQIRAKYICMSTRGAGALKKLMGTNATDILTAAPIPVIVVPKNYRISPVSHILYSSDWDNLTGELKKVEAFAKPLKAKISVYHYDFLLPLNETRLKLERQAAKHTSGNVKFYFQKLHIEHSLTRHLQKAIRNSRPSLVVLFTKQNRDWYERIFLSSKSASLSFETKIPLLIFKKGER